jgi:hypothetical protein
MDLRYKQWIIEAKIESNCNETGKKINIGDKVLYLKAIKNLRIPARVFCEESKLYKELYNHIDTGHSY